MKRGKSKQGFEVIPGYPKLATFRTEGFQSERMTQIEMASASLSSFSGQSTSSTQLIKPNLCLKKNTQKRQPSIDAMRIFFGGTGSLSKWTVRPKEFNRIRFLIYYFVNMCP